MARVIPPVFNNQLLRLNIKTFLQEPVIIQYSCEPNAVGIAIRGDSLDTYRVYCTNEHGALDWEKSYSSADEALAFARKFFVCYEKYLYDTDDKATEKEPDNEKVISTIFLKPTRKSSGKKIPHRQKQKYFSQRRANFQYHQPSQSNQCRVIGGKRLQGEICIGGSASASLAILAGTLLTSDVCRIENIANVMSVRSFLNALTHIGASIQFVGETAVAIDCSNIDINSVSNKLPSDVWELYYLLGTFLGRFGQIELFMPYTAGYQDRTLEQHIKGFTAMGAEMEVRNGRIYAYVPRGGRLSGASIYLDAPSVEATINIMLAATLAQGKTTIANAAKEPYITNLAIFLNNIGANISGAGTDVIKIQGVEKLRGGTYSVIPDPIEAGTYMTAVAAAGGSILLQNVIPEHLKGISVKLREMGVKITELDSSILVESNAKLRSTTVKTMPYPGFPVELCPQIAVCMVSASGVSIISTNEINRSRHHDSYIDQLMRLGACIQMDEQHIAIEGIKKLRGCSVHAYTPQSGAAMVVAGLAAEGTTTVTGINYINYEFSNMVEKLVKVGADIKPNDDGNTSQKVNIKIG